MQRGFHKNDNGPPLKKNRKQEIIPATDYQKWGKVQRLHLASVEDDSYLCRHKQVAGSAKKKNNH